MSWQKVNDYWAKNADFTLTQIPGVPYPYGLYKNNLSHGYFKTQEEALEKFKELSNG